ncbi:LysR family transcriptional regulator [Polycladidibacter stylochi]|uniref:LysR family transcriptional regulator n=1 Tax=Polycladidibacter stylochi TaxID=1807766 RepID=UPI00082A0C8E|nr:LysR family transcriptional regulator [Pseudovibrio stylochi]
MITLRQLNSFLVVAQEGSITLAAERLLLTKSAVSMNLSELEKHLGQRLFDRSNNRLRLNEQGKKLLPMVDELLLRTQAIETLFTTSQNTGDTKAPLTGRLRIGASYTTGNHVIPYLIQDFRKHTYHTNQSLIVTNSSEVAEMLNGFELDIGFIEGRVQEPELLSIPWRQDQMVVVCAPSHPLAQRFCRGATPAPIHMQHLDNVDWVLRESGSGTREFFLTKLAPYLEQWHIAFELNNSEAILSCVMAGLGLTCISQLAVQDLLAQGRLCALPLDIDMHRQYALLYHREKYLSPLISAFIQFSRNWQGALLFE